MGLFTSPVTLNDGVGSRIFTYRGLTPNAKTLQGDYIESAASLAARSLLVAKIDNRSPVIRSLLQCRINLHPAADTETDDLYPVVFNYTMTAHELFTVAELTPQHVLLQDALGEANVLQSLRLGII